MQTALQPGAGADNVVMKSVQNIVVTPYSVQGEDYSSLKVIRDRVLGALGAHHGMKAADPAPVADLHLGPVKGGKRSWDVQLGNYRAAGTYNLSTGAVNELEWKYKAEK